MMGLFHLVIPDRCEAAGPESITAVLPEPITAVVMDSGFLAEFVIGPATSGRSRWPRTDGMKA
jgi:hypothetical protein